MTSRAKLPEPLLKVPVLKVPELKAPVGSRLQISLAQILPWAAVDLLRTALAVDATKRPPCQSALDSQN